MRDILFKAKDVQSGEWIEGLLVITKEEYSNEIYYAIFEKESEHVCMGEYKDNGHYQIDPNTICQFTGLKDKNGNKIWENDIVRLDEDLYIITWEEDDAMFALEDVGIVEHFSNVDSKWCEVIGNKFDNPELV